MISLYWLYGIYWNRKGNGYFCLGFMYCFWLDCLGEEGNSGNIVRFLEGMEGYGSLLLFRSGKVEKVFVCLGFMFCWMFYVFLFWVLLGILYRFGACYNKDFLNKFFVTLWPRVLQASLFYFERDATNTRVKGYIDKWCYNMSSNKLYPYNYIYIEPTNGVFNMKLEGISSQGMCCTSSQSIQIIP